MNHSTPKECEHLLNEEVNDNESTELIDLDVDVEPVTLTPSYLTADVIHPGDTNTNTEVEVDLILDLDLDTGQARRSFFSDTMDQVKINKGRNLASFWIFGLCNNFAYVVMLSAAHDILDDHTKNNSTSGNSSLPFSTSPSPTGNNDTEYMQCNAIGTGAILLADIVPTLIVKLTLPFFFQRIPYSIKIALVGFFSAASFVIVSSAHQLWLSILGVICASIGSGLGEITFLSLSTFYDKNVVSSWSSGTGGAGVLGAIAYAGLTSAGVTPRVSLLLMISIPVFMLLSYKFLLTKQYLNQTNEDSADTDTVTNNDSETEILLNQEQKINNTLTMRRKLLLIPTLFKYMIPLSAVYFAEYFINQGLHEVLYFNGVFLSRKEQYRWFQVDYQIGVFISRSSVNLIKIKHLWILPILQFANMALLIFQVFYRFIPNVWIILAIIFWEGLLGGAAYVNTFYLMSIELASDIKEYCMGIASVADSLGIAIAGAVAVPTHKQICGLHLKI